MASPGGAGIIKKIILYSFCFGTNETIRKKQHQSRSHNFFLVAIHSIPKLIYLLLVHIQVNHVLLRQNYHYPNSTDFARYKIQIYTLPVILKYCIACQHVYNDDKFREINYSDLILYNSSRHPRNMPEQVFLVVRNSPLSYSANGIFLKDSNFQAPFFRK